MVKMYSVMLVGACAEDSGAMLQGFKGASVDGPALAQTASVALDGDWQDEDWKFASQPAPTQTRAPKKKFLIVSSYEMTPFRWSPGWFVDEVADLKKDAAVLVADAASCNKLTPSRALPYAASLAHNNCRYEQLKMLGLNSGTDCEESKKKDCDALQSQFEQVVCAHGKSCKAVEACHKGVADAFVELKKREAEHKEMFVTATKEDCGREHRRGTDEAKAACAALQPGTSHLSITYASEPDVVCTEYRVIPGSPGWITEEYSHQKWSQLAVAVTSCAEDHGIEQISAGPTTYR
jgi:hypothetical protein